MIQRMFLLAALSAVLTTPACMQAQAAAGSMNSAASMAAPADVFNKMLSDQEKEFVDAADAMPADKFNYAPTTGEFKGVRNFGDQVKHVAGANYGFFATWNIPNMKSRADLDKLSTKPEIMQALRDSFGFAHAAMSTITAENAFAQAGQGTRAGTAAHALAHMMDHYGQMVEYLRMNGIVPPASRKSAM